MMTPKAMQSFDTSLPIDTALPGLTAALSRNNAAVLVAPPGAGKTTRVPLVLLDEPWARTKKISGSGAAPARCPCSGGTYGVDAG